MQFQLENQNKKYKHIFEDVSAYKAWKAKFSKVKHKAFMDLSTGKIYVAY